MSHLGSHATHPANPLVLVYRVFLFYPLFAPPAAVFLIEIDCQVAPFHHLDLQRVGDGFAVDTDQLANILRKGLDRILVPATIVRGAVVENPLVRHDRTH